MVCNQSLFVLSRKWVEVFRGGILFICWFYHFNCFHINMMLNSFAEYMCKYQACLIRICSQYLGFKNEEYTVSIANLSISPFFGTSELFLKRRRFIVFHCNHGDCMITLVRSCALVLNGEINDIERHRLICLCINKTWSVCG